MAEERAAKRDCGWVVEMDTSVVEMMAFVWVGWMVNMLAVLSAHP
jgi:hypothetical protein